VVHDPSEGHIDVVLVQKDVPVPVSFAQAPYVSPVVHQSIFVVYNRVAAWVYFWLRRTHIGIAGLLFRDDVRRIDNNP
jgi:hypothetical protein